MSINDTDSNITNFTSIQIDTSCVSESNFIKIGFYIALVISGFSFILNLFLPITILSAKILRKRFNIYLAAFGICSSLSIIIYTLNIISDILGEWKYGEIWCKTNAYLREICVIFSTYLLLLVALDRYFQIFKSSKYRNKLDNYTKNIIIGIIISLIIAIPFPVIYYVDLDTCGKIKCIPNKYGKTRTAIIYAVEGIIVFLIPLILILYLYFKIFIVFWNHNKFTKLDENKITKYYANNRKFTEQAIEHIQSKKNLHRELITSGLIIAIFFTTWTPYLIIRITRYTISNTPKILIRISQFLFLCYLWMYPQIYFFTSPKIKTAIKNKFVNIFR